MHWLLENFAEIIRIGEKKFRGLEVTTKATFPKKKEPKLFEVKKKVGVKKEIKPKSIVLRSRKIKEKPIEILPVRVDKFDELIADKGVERGSTILLSGGTGTGKTTFCLQSIYYAAKNGEKGIFISFEEEPEKIKKHMKKNFGWNFYKLEKKGLVAIIKFDPVTIARQVEEALLQKTGGLKIEFKRLELPFVPDRIAVDNLSALSIAFEEEEGYRKYIRELFETLEENNSVNFVIAETEQNPKIYSRTGIEEFLADGVIVMYNLKKDGKRENAIEILKLRSSKHVKKMVPYKMGPNGIELILSKG